MKLLSRPRLHFIKIVKTNIFRKIKREREIELKSTVRDVKKTNREKESNCENKKDMWVEKVNEI